jgi:hypothetical protein
MAARAKTLGIMPVFVDLGKRDFALENRMAIGRGAEVQFGQC